MFYFFLEPLHVADTLEVVGFANLLHKKRLLISHLNGRNAQHVLFLKSRPFRFSSKKNPRSPKNANLQC